MDFFIEILNLSLVSSYVIVFVLIARLLLKKAPKIYSYMLWVIVFVRLTCSFTIELPVGLISEIQPIQTDIFYQNIPEINTQNITINTNSPPITQPATSVNSLELQMIILKNIWLIGVALMLSYNLFSYVKLKRNLAGMLFKDNIYFSDYITSPFVIDMIKPKIYLPSDIKASEIDFIITHEKTHIKRFDHVTRVVAFFVLSLHWFNPLVWCAYFLSGQDMELSCDEEVIKQTSSDIRKEYSQSLLNFAVGRVYNTRIVTTPAFGVNITIDTKERIQNIMKFKKPVAWVTALAITSVTVLSIGCMATTSANDDSSISINQVSQDELYKLAIEKNDITFSGLITSQFFSGSEIEDIKYNHYDFVLENIEFYIAGNEVYLGEKNIANIVIDEEENNLLVTFDIETDTKSKISYEFNIDKIDNSFNLIKNNTSSDFNEIITTDVITLLALEIYDFAKNKDSGVDEISVNQITDSDNSRFNYEKDGITLSIANTSDLFNVIGETTMIISYDTKLTIDEKDIHLDDSKSTLISFHENEAEQSFSFILHSDSIGEHITHNFSIDNDGNITSGTSELTEYFEELITLQDIQNICMYFYEIAKTQTHNTIYYDDSYGGEVMFELEENETIVE